MFFQSNLRLALVTLLAASSAALLPACPGLGVFSSDECSLDRDCGRGVCHRGQCVECESDHDCDDDEFCEDEECVAGTAGEGEGEGEGEGDPPPPPDPEGPRILQLSTSTDTLFDDEILIVTVVVTDPDGVNDVIGGSLLRPAGGQTYGTFQTSASEGAYELQLSWNELNNVQSVEFDAAVGGTRQFRVQFFDQAGHATAQDFSVALACRSGGSACDGFCGESRCGSQCVSSTSNDACGSCDVQCSGSRSCSLDFDSSGFICAGLEDDDAGCSDGVDNDGNGFTDCNDFDCSQSAFVTVCGPHGQENTDAVCDDGINNDADGFLDCDDFDCSRNISVGICGSDTCGLDAGSNTGFVRSGTLSGFSRSEGSCGGDGPDNVWKWTPPFSGTFQIDTGGSFASTVLYVRSACGDFFDLACDDSGTRGGTSTVSLSLTAGVPILIAVDSAAGFDGSYSLNINAI